jgi:hypothetical protein
VDLEFILVTLGLITKHTYNMPTSFNRFWLVQSWKKFFVITTMLALLHGSNSEKESGITKPGHLKRRKNEIGSLTKTTAITSRKLA